MKIVFSEYFDDVYFAISAERQIKRWKRVKKEALVRGDFKLLHEFAKCKNETHFSNVNKNDLQT